MSLKLCEELKEISIPFDVENAIKLRRESGADEPEIDESAIQNFPLAVYLATQSLDWEYLFSREAFYKSSKQHKGLVESQYISTGLLIRNIIRDKVDHRFEYRKQILVNCLSSYFSDVGPITYEELVEKIERRLEIRESRLSRQIEMDLNPYIIKKEEKLIDEAKFLRHIIGSEKSWLIKFLRS